MATSVPPPPAVPGPAGGGRPDRIPPYSEEAEKGVLGAALLDAERVVDLCLSRKLGVGAFYLRSHQVLFETMVNMLQGARPIDLLTLSEALRSQSMLDAVGGSTYLEQLVDSTPTPAHAEYYIDIVKQKYLFRTMIERARETIDVCYEPDRDADEVLGEAEQSFFEIADLQEGPTAVWSELVKKTMKNIETIFQSRTGLTGTATGFIDIDNLLMGLQDGDMIILAARPSMGKTSLAMNIAEHVAAGYRGCSGRYREQEPRPVGIFSLEMSGDQLVHRMVCSHAKVSSAKIAKGVAPKTAHGHLAQAADVLTKAKLYLDDTAGLSALELRSRARRLKRKYDVGLIIVDYLQLVHFPQYGREGRQREVSAISGAMKAMAKELRIPVLVLSQLSRAPETRDRKAVPKLSDLRDSGSIEQDADVVMLLRRPCRYPDDPDHEDETLTILDIAKHRNGPTGEIHLNFEEEFTRFTDRKEGVDHGLEPAVVSGEFGA